ncbi:MAG: hypothetical protein ACOX61_02190 [Brooklawnia sp.]|jgi:hypothetical protein
MANPIYQAFARVFGVVLPVVGVGAMIGGRFAHRFVADQLEAEAITMPDEATIERELKIGLVAPEDAERLRPYAGQTVTTGPHARIYSDNYVLAHMLVAASRAGVPAHQATYAGVGDLATEKNQELKTELREQFPQASPAEISHLARAEVGDPETDYDIARQIKQLHELRSENFFMGNAIRGMLLNAYGWWLVGLVARIAGYGLLGAGAVLGAIGWLGGSRR